MIEKSERELELERKLAEVNARRDARRKEREERDAKSEPEAKLREAELLDALEAALVDAEAQYGKLGVGTVVVHAKHADGTLVGGVILRTPKDRFWRKFQGQLADTTGAKREEAIAELWQHCRVWPEIGAVEDLVKKLPNLPTRMMLAVSRLADGNSEEVAGKS